MDIVRQKQIREWALLGLVGAMALVANLPPQVLREIGIESGLLMAIMGLMVVLALFLYVRFFFFLLYALLAIGANLPEKSCIASMRSYRCGTCGMLLMMLLPASPG